LCLTRFNFAKKLLEKRKKIGVGAKENVLVSFGGKQKGVTYVKSKEKPMGQWRE
jgi:hypothetical protein